MYTFISLRLHSGDLEELEAGLADKVRQAPGFFNNAPVVVDFSVLERQCLEDADSNADDADVADAATDASIDASTEASPNSLEAHSELEAHSDDSAADASSTDTAAQIAEANTEANKRAGTVSLLASIDAEAITECIRRHRLVPVMASVADKQSALAQQIPLPLIETSTRETELQMPGKTAHAATPNSRTAVVTAATDSNDGDGDGDGNDDAEPGNRADATSDVSEATAEAAAQAVETTKWDAPPPLLVDRPVRSGQQVYARNADLIILGQVGPGAEIVADNNIHVYGPLRGRALCGVKGNADARIFCQSLEAELVSVAGNYRVLEEIPDEVKNRPAQIKLAGGKIVIDPL